MHDPERAQAKVFTKVETVVCPFDECGSRMFVNQHALDIHMGLSHPRNDLVRGDGVSLTNGQGWICDQIVARTGLPCNKVFKSVKVFTNHRNLKHLGDIRPPARLSCTVDCSFVARKAHVLRHHLRSAHGVIDEYSDNRNDADSPMAFDISDDYHSGSMP